jgi:hypothetical protein
VSVVMLREIRARRQKLAGETVVVEAVGRAAVTDPRRSAAVLAAKSHRASRDRKAEQDAFEREQAFSSFDALPSDVMNNQHAAGKHLDRIAAAIFIERERTRSLAKIRRRLGELRKEFLTLRAKGQI